MLVPNSVGVSSDVLYNLKNSCVRARSYRLNLPSSNKSSFLPQDVAIFSIPGGRRNTFLDCQQSYIKMQIRNYDSANTLLFDGNGSSFISRLDIFHSSNLIETIQAYGVLYQYLIDFTTDSSFKLGVTTAWGTTADRNGITLAKATAALYSHTTVCMPILSAIIGSTADKMLPIGELNDDVRVEVTFADVVTGAVVGGSTAQAYATLGTNGVGWGINNVELVLQIVELSDEGMAIVHSATDFRSPVHMHGVSYRHFTSILPASSSGTYTTLVPARFASLKNLILCPRSATTITDTQSYSISSRVNPLFSQFWYRIGAFLVPQKPINLYNPNNCGAYAEAFCETMRSLHGLNNTLVSSSVGGWYNTCDTVDGTSLVQVALTAGNSYKNAFAYGQELESFANRSDTLLCGMNTLNSQIFFEANIAGLSTTSTTAVAYTLDFYALFDQITTLENGILSARF